MKSAGKLLFLLAPVILLAAGARSFLNHSPLSVFLLKGGDDAAEAFRLKLYLDGQDSTAEAVSLTADQKKNANLILRQKNLNGLVSFSKEFGASPIVIGTSSFDEGWPPELGGGLPALLNSERANSFDNLHWPDRIYLCLGAKAPPPAPLMISENALPPAGNPLPTPPTGNSVTAVNTPSVFHTGALRVEILNGCGIKGAAEWAARRLKGAGIIITETGNAEHFHFPKTQVWTSAGVPVSLEDAIDRLGLTREDVQESTTTPSTVDVVVVVGKDYRLLKERVRDRRHNGTQ